MRTNRSESAAQPSIREVGKEPGNITYCRPMLQPTMTSDHLRSDIFIMQTLRSAFAVICIASTLCVAPHLAVACDAERYFAPDDSDNQRALAAPHSEFVKTQRLAARGSARAERDLAVYYEAGYLVSRCTDKAVYWYGRAASHGDEVAKNWAQRHANLDRLRDAPECFGNACLAHAQGGTQVVSLRANASGQYATMVTINGKSVRGVIDTGATLVSMSARTAEELGISYERGRRLQVVTANGTVANRAVMLDSVTVGNITLRQVEGAVGENDMPVLIGMSFLKRLVMSTDGASMTLVKR